MAPLSFRLMKRPRLEEFRWVQKQWFGGSALDTAPPIFPAI
ncbi:hypothetical protein CHCC20375_2484 [Bacillus licheniformis]|nr:hypothetical protein CHCC20375_2484 [Bacillus licheniformis]